MQARMVLVTTCHCLLPRHLLSLIRRARAVYLRIRVAARLHGQYFCLLLSGEQLAPLSTFLGVVQNKSPDVPSFSNSGRVYRSHGPRPMPVASGSFHFSCRSSWHAILATSILKGA